MRFKYTIFDYDGTICHTHPAISYTLEKTFDYFKFRVPNLQTRLEIIGTGKGLGETITSLVSEGEDFTKEHLDLMILKYREIYNDEGEMHAEIFPGAQNLFLALHSAGIPIIVVSNKGINAVQNSLKNFCLMQYTDTIIAEGILPNVKLKLKPDAMMFNEIILPKYKNINYNNTIVVGDTKADIQFAKNCNLSSAWIKHGYGSEKECMALEPDYIAEDLEQLSQILFKC